MSEPMLLCEDRDGIRTLTLNNPAARNALSGAMMASLHDAFIAAASEPAVRVVILAANGPAFCAGHDLKEIRGNSDPAFHARLMDQCVALMLAIVRCPKPVIARVHAIATAAGCQLVASCDLAVAADSAHFATPGVNIGLFCSTPMVALSRNLGRKHAMEMLLTGDLLNAARRLAHGAAEPRGRGRPTRCQRGGIRRNASPRSPRIRWRSARKPSTRRPK